MTDEHLGELPDMAAALVAVLSEPFAIDDALKAAATEYGTSPGRMKYALSFARSRGMVYIDYDEATVSRNRPENVTSTPRTCAAGSE